MRPYVKLPPSGIDAATIQSWTVPDLCAHYGWPTGVPGGGKIGIVELGGGFTRQDINWYFKQQLLWPIPDVKCYSVDPGTGNAADGSNADIEVTLDILIASASYYVATGKPAEVTVYFCSNDLNGIARGIDAASKEGCSTCSISWGADEAEWGTDAANSLEAAVLAAAQVGMITFAASGDNDSSDGGPGSANVDLPASAPHTIGCGGTTLPKAAWPETVWNNAPGRANGEGTGGGISSIFPRPTWQTVHYGNRMVPDVAANADPMTGYSIMYLGEMITVGGTSCVAPLYAGLGAALGVKLGFVSPVLWAHPEAFNDIVIGNNGMYMATVGPDPCTGLGTPKATTIAALFRH